MGFQDVALLPPELVLLPCLINCGRCECLGTATCLKTVVGVGNGMLPVKYFLSTKLLFVSVDFHGGHKAVTMMR